MFAPKVVPEWHFRSKPIEEKDLQDRLMAISSNRKYMKCPHCLVDYHPQIDMHAFSPDIEGYKRIDRYLCSACGNSSFVLSVLHKETPANMLLHENMVIVSIPIYPRISARAPCPKEVPQKFSEDYNEACLVLVDSPKASAALSRRCLQNILRDYAKITPKDLSKEIQEILDKGNLPTHLSQSLDAIRNIGNFAAHPIKSESSGEIVPVEPGEAEWCLDVIEGLFDYYFVQPSILAQKRAALDKKLSDAGKPPLKR